ncbi:hypothetical protein NA57DRAFT_52490 [Rhizodiscina lignyota]|uniref:DH domain-containing protein n=1 Tax=Rhizodiscina lignyota TaxID=1504668 RepID=A0A9P4INV6_9PEZI|nr:hypothetical protein NA57DRAFT_52490 [Rhizodiscina lignyota]
MVALTPPPPALSPESLELFYVVDELLARSPILCFYGPSATATSSATSSRIQAHVFSPAGLQSYPRLTISPSSPLYAAINCLPREEQGDEICRGLAFSIYKYFAELPDSVRSVWEQQPTALGRQPHAPKLFSDAHAAILASRMTKVENVEEVVKDVKQALSEQDLSWLDIDLVLPPGTMRQIDARESLDDSDDGFFRQRYGGYASVVKLFGEPAFLPTSKLRRAPSKPSGLNRNASFSRRQKESLRREMCELLDTEESYVSKLHDLLHSVAFAFREKASNKSSDSTSPSAQALEKLFPPSLDVILKTNTEFLEAMRSILEETENEAIKDIESTSPDDVLVSQSAPSTADVTGAASLAQCLLDWLPKFSDCYTDYIHAHSQFSQFLKIFMSETGSSFSKRIQETGEQRLMSMLIEPVQRLPRYNLYIDNIIKQLPARHSAIKLFLKARNTIAEICSRDVAPMTAARVVEILSAIAPIWPASLAPMGRIISAVDVSMLEPPYRIDLQHPRTTHGILLFFTDTVVLLHKKSKQSTSARTLLGMLDGTNVIPPNTADGEDLAYRQHMRLADVEFSELQDGKLIQLIHSPSQARPFGPRRPRSRSLDIAVQVYYLSGAYENRAVRLSEEIAKARVESRFSEAERESHKWEVRSTGASGAELHLFTSLFEDPTNQMNVERGPPAKVRIVVDPLRGSRTIKPGQDGVDIVGNLTIQGEGFFKLEMSSAGEAGTKDHITTKEFLAVLGKRLSNALQNRGNIRNPNLTPLLLARNQQILQSLNVVVETNDVEMSSSTKDSFRAPSPVKLLSNLFGGSVPSSPTKHSRGALSLGNVPTMLPASTSSTSLPDTDMQPVLRSPTRPKSIFDLSGAASLAVPDSTSNLEQTLSSYVLALHARKGNIVGRVLRARAHSADEAAVNELYNTLLEDPASHHAAAQAPVDVLFAAFEKFVKVAWTLEYGYILDPATLTAVQIGQDFTDSFRSKFAEMNQQNRAAIRDIVKLLADLLDGTASDGDRGILTAAFAEVLITGGSSSASAHELFSILDRFVEDFHTLFAPVDSVSGHATPSKASVNSENRSSRLINAAADAMAGLAPGSGMGSNHSSLRKKFGFSTLHRKNSKADSHTEPESTSVWRTLSKGRSTTLSSVENPPSLVRSKSQDERDRVYTPKRPVSRDRPTVMGAFEGERRELSTIGENAVAGPPRKKRRSSLSDLGDLKNSPLPPRLELQLPQSPRLTGPVSGSPVGSPSPVRSGIPQRKGSMMSPAPLKENVKPNPYSTLPRLAAPLSPTGTGAGLTRGSPNRPAGPRVVGATSGVQSSDEVVITAHNTSPSKRRAGSVTNSSGIPSLRSPPPPLNDGPGAANIARFPPPSGTTDKSISPVAPPSPTRKLRMQSPQKLRERLTTEAKSVKEADDALAQEMAKIGEELNALGSAQRPGSSSSRPGTASSAGSAALHHLSNGSGIADPKFRTLEARLKTLEAAIPTTIASLSKRLTAIEADVSSSLAVSESKARGLDEALRDANKENEALYGRFNEELARVSKGVKEAGMAELRRQMGGMREESERLRKENARLRREVVGLRAQLRE